MVAPIQFNPNGFVNFSPYGTIAVTGATSSVGGTFTSTASINASSVMVYNGGANVAFISFGNGSATATVPTGTEANECTPIAAGAVMVLTKGTGFDKVAVITATSTSVVYFTAGRGA